MPAARSLRVVTSLSSYLPDAAIRLVLLLLSSDDRSALLQTSSEDRKAVYQNFTALTVKDADDETLFHLCQVDSSALNALTITAAFLSSSAVSAFISGSCPNLTALSLEHVQLEPYHAKHLTAKYALQLSSLRFRHCSLKAKCLHELSHTGNGLAAQWPCLVVLELFGANLAKQHVQNWIQGQYPMLQFVSFGACSLGSDAMAVLAMTDFTKLVGLDLSLNHLTLSAMASFAGIKFLLLQRLINTLVSMQPA